MSGRWTPNDLANYQARRSAPVKAVSFPESHHFVVPGDPVAKPRQTRSDKWKERPCVIRYREWADKARRSAGLIPLEAQHADIVAYLALPLSWSTKKRNEMAGTPHRSKPDIDNLVKSCMDALLSRDQGIHEVRARKRWDDGQGPRVEITLY